MPRLTEPDRIRAILEADRAWAAYALGDLAPGYFEHCEWHAAAQHPPALVLLYRAFETPVLFALGPAPQVGPLLDEIDPQPRLYLSVPPPVLPLVRARYRVRQEVAMWRMTLEPADFRPAPTEQVARLGPEHLPALVELYADGELAGEAPDFFQPEMVARGVFFGVWERGTLVAAAGTHLLAASESVAAVGNVYTRRDRRGRGLARRTTSAVAAALLAMGLRTVVLNVSQSNAAAVRVYEGLGFVRYTPFYEGLAVGHDAPGAAVLE